MCPGSERLDDEVGGLDQLLEDGLPLSHLDVQGDPPLVGVVGHPVEALLGIGDVVVEGAHGAAGVAAGGLDLDDIGAEIAEHPPAEEALLIRQVQDSERGQGRLRRLPSISTLFAAAHDGDRVSPVPG